MTPPPRDAAPVTQAERVVSLDVLRGVAVLGILALNIKAFSMVGAAYSNPTALGELTGADAWAWYLTHIFGDLKFMGIFSMLFGAGVVLMTGRAEARTGHSAGLHYRRMLWLLLIGLMHGYLLWFGDILVLYALCGMLIYWLRRLPPAALLVIGGLFLLVGSGLSMMFGLSMPSWPAEQVEAMRAEWWAPPPEAIAEEIEIYRGSWLEQMPHRATAVFGFQTMGFLVFGLWRAGGMMLLGMGLFKLGVFSAKRSLGFYLALVVVGLGFGVPLAMAGVRYCEAHGWDVMYAMFQGQQFNWWAAVGISLGYVGLVMLACRAAPGSMLLRPFAAAGQMAFTNYIMQTVICTTIFYGHGFGVFGSLGRAEQMLVVAAVWVFQLIVSPLWLAAFRYGPLEWLWRSLTYWRIEPFRRRPVLVPAPT